MIFFNKKPSSLRAIVFLTCLLVLESCSESSVQNSTIFIHGGSAGGTYNELVEMLNSRSKILKTVKLSDGENCNIYREGCALLSKFEFLSICENGGSKTNLTRLGMRTRGDNAFAKIGECNTPPYPEFDGSFTTSAFLSNDFALVQNYFIAGAAQTYCGERVNKFGPDVLHYSEFSLKRPLFKYVDVKCDQFFAEQMGGEYEPFDDLRIVLPLYNGLVQFVTATKVSEGNDRLPTKTLEDLAKTGEKIYWRGVNSIYGAEVLNRDPRFHSERIENSIDNTQWRFDENLILEPDTVYDFIDTLQTGADTEEVKAFILAAEESERGDRLLACGVIGAYVISGQIIDEGEIMLSAQAPDSCQGSYARQQIQIPEVIIDAMAVDHPYYQKLPPPAFWPTTQITATPGLITYLVTTSSADDALVAELTKALTEDWDSLMLLDPKLTPIQDNILKKPAPFHDGAVRSLLEADLLGGGFAYSTFVAVLILIIAAMIGNHHLRSSLAYNRLGEKRQLGLRSLARQEALEFAIIILWWVFVFMFVVTAIRNWDAAIAATQNADDQISALTFTRTLLWMFTFISSGYEDNVFPTSSASQIVVSFFAIAGIAYPLFLIAQTWDRIRIKRLDRARGGEYPGFWRRVKDRMLESWPWSYRRNGTLLLCGWNDKAPGLVYALTCQDSPYEGMLSIIANTEVEYPIEHYNFNKSRVRFYRGDASHRSELERAEASRATSALILSEHSRGTVKNNAGVLVALAIERLKGEIPVFAEMSVDEVDREFMEDHIDNIVDPKLIARQVLTIGCFDNYVLDFVLDALSPDHHYEWYSKQVHELKHVLPEPTKSGTVEELSRALQKIGVSLIGTCSTKNELVQSSAVFAPRFESSSLDPLKSLKDLGKTINEDDYVVCAAHDPRVFKPEGFFRRRKETYLPVNFAGSHQSIVRSLRASASILIIGHEDQANSIAQHMKETVSRISVSTAVTETVIVATDLLMGNELDVAIIKELDKREWSHILLLSSIPATQTQKEHTRLATRADSDTILRASFIRATLAKKGQAIPIMVAEVNRTNSRQLAKDASVTTVVPSSLLIERILARLVSGGGIVSELLCAMLSMEEDVFLTSCKLHGEHPLVGQKYSIALNTWYEDGRVLGILPKSNVHGMTDKHKNSSDDFDWHFMMCPPVKGEDKTLEVGDVVIILACSQ
jgi:hypothetical protein